MCTVCSTPKRASHCEPPHVVVLAPVFLVIHQAFHLPLTRLPARRCECKAHRSWKSVVASKEEATSSSSSGTVVSVPVSAYKNQPLHEQRSSVAHMSQKSAFQIDLARDRQQRYRQSAPPKCHVRRSRGSMVGPVCGGARMEALSSFLCSNADALRFCERVDAKHTCWGKRESCPTSAFLATVSLFFNVADSPPPLALRQTLNAAVLLPMLVTTVFKNCSERHHW